MIYLLRFVFNTLLCHKKKKKNSNNLFNTKNMAKQMDRLVNVWEENLEEEMKNIRDLVEDYPFVSMDTEFPGVVARPMGTFHSTSEFNYQTLRCNVDLLSIIQLGITFSDVEGRLKPGKCTWQFNFKFDLSTEMHAQNSIDLLRKSGVDFDKLNKHGINLRTFGELLTVSGLVMNEDVHWITFHSGYDFGYLIKILTCAPLPKTDTQFFELLSIFFPNTYDLKYMMKDCENLKGGLQKLADDLQVERVGQMHTAGSDSLLTHASFFKMTNEFSHLDSSNYTGILFGLGKGYISGVGGDSVISHTE
eukprot:c20259_g2_i1.p1 GENE.c20259_g2_i1~~c20259_g2_i1.p1  ORF type:complete len:305 (+),score=66.17 c20259_g2_i1:471-1385(+)